MNTINADDKSAVNMHGNTDVKEEMDERDEIVKMWKHMDEKLEMKAKSLNLTAINVKSILHVSFNTSFVSLFWCKYFEI